MSTFLATVSFRALGFPVFECACGLDADYPVMGIGGRVQTCEGCEMGFPAEVAKLVERFDKNRDEYMSSKFNEAQARIDFIDPLVASLGWDVHNYQGRPEAYRDVIYEDRVKVGGGTKAPDYGFYIGGNRKFFLEAKKPSVDIRGDVNPAVQLRRYAWSAKLPLSILTDFEEFAVYDCRFEPTKEDKPETARLDFFTYDQYEEYWDVISSRFSREAVLNGSLDKYAEETKRKRGTRPVDDAFLKEIEDWRSALAKDLAARNDLNQRQLNYAVQMLIDRLIFLRMTEDRGVEDYQRLYNVVEGGGVYRRLCDVFRDADDRYNSGLFHFRDERGREEEPDRLTLGLDVEDGLLRKIVRGLYYPESPYEFSVLPVDVLGQVYEQFLGSVIRLEGGHKAVVEQKPEVRKAGGVYYTPTYIVDYIVERTVGKLLEGKRPGPRGGVSRLKIVDPACGSGSFLLGAYRYLLDWHRDRYLEDGPEKWAKELYQGSGGQWHLTIDEKKRILLNNVYGVDIDPQAVEVTKLSLLLKVLEGESDSSLSRQLSLIQERALPDLDENIKCGNSLISSDFYSYEQMELMDEEEIFRINVFDWKEEFPQVFNGTTSGFDAVIGNPPYLNVRLLTQVQGDDVKRYFKAWYSCAYRGYDLYVLFVEKALEILTTNGLFGMIVPNKLATLDYALKCRTLLLTATAIENIADVSNLPVFGGAGVYPYIVVSTKRAPDRNHNIEVLQAEFSEDLRTKPVTTHIVQSSLSPEQGLALHGVFDIESRVETEPLSHYAKLHSGTTGFAAEQMAGRLIESASAPRGKNLDFIVSGNIDRYEIKLGKVRFMNRAFQRPVLPLEAGGLTENKLNLYQNPKLVFAGMTKRLEVAFDSQGLALGVQVYAAMNMSANPFYLLGILNSKFMSYLFRMRYQAKHLAGGFLAINKSQLSQLPIRSVASFQPQDTAQHNQMVKLIALMLELHKRLARARIGRERTVIGNQINAVDQQIDSLVYELYRLTDEEIAVVEEAIIQ